MMQVESTDNKGTKRKATKHSDIREHVKHGKKKCELVAEYIENVHCSAAGGG